MIESSEKRKLREATVAGIFYPEEADALNAEVDRLLAQAEPLFAERQVRRARAIFSPHASLGYSGDLAALAWKAATGAALTQIVILSPYHRAETSLVYLPEAEYFETPLGAVPVDLGSIEELLECGTLFTRTDIPHFEEHGIEMQLPFMQKLFPRATLVPILVGKTTKPLVRALASALGIVFSERAEETLFVVSSDLASCGRRGSAETRAEAEERAERILECIAQRDWRGLLAEHDHDALSACGDGAMAALLASPLGAELEGLVLGRHDSAAYRESEEERLVFYAALAFVPRGEGL